MISPRTDPGKPRRGLFRQQVLDLYRGPQSAAKPDTLPPWRPGPIRFALGIVIVLALLWLIP